jgi:hypothetical protein
MEMDDVLIVGGGAAGLMAGVWAGRTAPGRAMTILDGAPKLGAKILVAGGGRCNVTHDTVSADQYAGASPNAIKKVLQRFDVPQTVEFFRELGVELKREATGKLFPVTNKARTVLDALMSAAQDAGVMITHMCRVDTIQRKADGLFEVQGTWGERRAAKVILATGGKSLPKTGSDGHGYQLAMSLGHSVTARIFPALVPLLLPDGHFIRTLSGITLLAQFTLWSQSGKKLKSFTDSTLCTHFGLSGPAVLDISRYYAEARSREAATLTINWLPQYTTEALDATLQALGKTSVSRFLSDLLPERLARALCDQVAFNSDILGGQLPRETRRLLTKAVTAMRLPIVGDRGFNYAEVTAGGVPLTEVRLETMESRVCPGLYLCGELCDVDGRIGGYNFQWAWASGFVAGCSAARAIQASAGAEKAG